MPLVTKESMFNHMLVEYKKLYGRSMETDLMGAAHKGLEVASSTFRDDGICVLNLIDGDFCYSVPVDDLFIRALMADLIYGISLHPGEYLATIQGW